MNTEAQAHNEFEKFPLLIFLELIWSAINLWMRRWPRLFNEMISDDDVEGCSLCINPYTLNMSEKCLFRSRSLQFWVVVMQQIAF